MSQPIRKSHPAITLINNSLIDLPAPNNLSIWWNFGSLLGLCLVMQILTGLFLAMHYAPHVDLAFSSIAHLTRDVNYGWLLRTLHANGGSWFFICIYLHIGRGMYYGSYFLRETWNIGVILLLLVMLTAFLGYVLPWGQMSFWGATVITNLLSAIPYLGKALVEWVWGGFAVDSATLTRFFAIHFMAPFLIVGLTALHFMFLHQTGSNNPLGVSTSNQKIPFHDYYSSKDLLGVILFLLTLTFVALFTPNLLSDPENFIQANPLVTPLHIMPEWYFLWAYAILRSIPNKLGGVIAMFMAILVLFLLPSINSRHQRGYQFHPLAQLFFWTFVVTLILLTWIGGRPVEEPYSWVGQILTALYFLLHFLLPASTQLWNLASK